MTQNNDHDFQQFRGAFDDAMIPDAAFKAKMEKLLQSEKPVEPERTSTVLASPSKKQSKTVLPPRRSHPLMIAVAILMVFSVAIASVWVLSGDVLQGEYASAPSGIATLPADAPGMPDEDVYLTAKPFLNWHEGDQLLGVYDDVLLSSRWAGETRQDDIVTFLNESGESSGPAYVHPTTLTARDAATGEILWEQTYEDLRVVGVHDGRIIALQNEWNEADNSALIDQHIAVFDLETGELTSSQPTDYVPQNPRQGMASPVVTGDHIVLATEDGTARGWSIDSGERVWETDFDAGDGWKTNISYGDGPVEEVTMRAVATTDWKDQVVIVNGDGTVILLDSSTGKPIAEHEGAPLPVDNAHVVNLELHSMANGVLIVRDVMGVGIVHETIAVDPAAGEVLWHRNLDGQARVDLEFQSENGSIALNDHDWKQYPDFLRFFGLNGYSTFQFTWLDGATGEVILETKRGKLEAPPVTLTDGNYACTRTERTEIICFDRLGTRHILDIEPRGDPILVYGVLYILTEDGLYRAELP